MTAVAIVSDTTHYLPSDLVQREGIHQVSLYVGWNGHPQRELDLNGYDSFYRQLAAEPVTPTTSQPSIGDFIAVWEPLLAQGLDIVSIHLAGGISGTCDAARQAHQLLQERDGSDLRDRVIVLDGETSCGGLGFLVLAAASAARAGADIHAVAEHVHQTRKAMKVWFCVDTLEYLRRGGRIGKAQAWLGGTLRIKPILTLGYEITPVERVRTSKRAFERMVEYARELASDKLDGWAIQHIKADDQADKLAERCKEIIGGEPVFISEVGPVIGTYTGPGLLGVGGVPRALLS